MSNDCLPLLPGVLPERERKASIFDLSVASPGHSVLTKFTECLGSFKD